MNEDGLVSVLRDSKVNYGRAVRIVRSARGLTQSALAERLSIGPSHLSLIEANKRKPSLAVLQDIASALDVPTHLLMLLAAGPEGLNRHAGYQDVNHLAHSLLALLVSSDDQGLLPLGKSKRKKLKTAS